jgi:DNA-binding transcriptional LysR family regulator
VALNGIDLNLLPALDALLAERNVTRAAERMSLGQPAMSAALARLRKHFGDPLLVRDGRGLVLTTLATTLIAPVQEAMAATEAVLGVRPPFDPRTDDRSFTLVGSDYVALVLLRPLVAELADEAPGVNINVVAVGAEMEDWLRRGSADLLIYPVEIAERYTDLPRTVLFEDRFVLAADRDNADIADGVDLARFSKLPFLAIGGPFPSLVEIQLDALGISRRTEFHHPVVRDRTAAADRHPNGQPGPRTVGPHPGRTGEPRDPPSSDGAATTGRGDVLERPQHRRRRTPLAARPARRPGLPPAVVTSTHDAAASWPGVSRGPRWPRSRRDTPGCRAC